MAYNPNQPRDNDGRWAIVDGSATQAAASDKAATALFYDRSKIKDIAKGKYSSVIGMPTLQKTAEGFSAVHKGKTVETFQTQQGANEFLHAFATELNNQRSRGMFNRNTSKDTRL